jgi:hypothetical protein
MSDDILEQATRALREETDAKANESARFTRSRVLASVHKTDRRRRSVVAFLLPIAAVLVGSTAFAASGGNWKRVAQVMGFVDPPATVAPPPEPPAPITRAARPRPTPAVVPEPQPAPEPTPEPTPEPAKPVVALKTKASAPPAVAADLSDPEIALYKKAHQLHFEGGSPGAALAAWEAYLAKSPRGRFAVEASYNRAIALTRLGRTGEARAALEPFANGRYGNYRKESANALLQALGARASE